MDAARRAELSRKTSAGHKIARKRRHSLYSPRGRLLLSRRGKLESDSFRRKLEEAVALAHGDIAISQAALVHSAVENYRLAISNREKLAELVEAGDVDPELRLKFDAEYSKLLDKRDAKIKALSLDTAGDKARNPLSYLEGIATEHDESGDSSEA